MKISPYSYHQDHPSMSIFAFRVRSTEQAAHSAFFCMQLEEHMSGQDSHIGAVHLAMQPANDSFILRWSHAVEAVVDPGMPQFDKPRHLRSASRCCFALARMGFLKVCRLAMLGVQI